jgi:hypothetical protein
MRSYSYSTFAIGALLLLVIGLIIAHSLGANPIGCLFFNSPCGGDANFYTILLLAIFTIGMGRYGLRSIHNIHNASDSGTKKFWKQLLLGLIIILAAAGIIFGYVATQLRQQ